MSPPVHNSCQLRDDAVLPTTRALLADQAGQVPQATQPISAGTGRSGFFGTTRTV